MLSSIGAAALLWFTLLGGQQGDALQEPSDPELVVSMYLWYVEGGEEHVTALTDDINEMSDAAKELDAAGLHSACAELKHDVDSAQDYRPQPDAEAQAMWSGALEHYEKAALYCMAGTGDQMDPNLLALSGIEMQAGTEQVDNLTERLQTIMN